MDEGMISLPTDLWQARLPASLHDRAPRVERRDGAAVWTCEGETWGRWAGVPRPAGPKPIVNALDRGGMDETELRPANAPLRLADMDRDGVEAQVIYGPITSMIIADPELRQACVRAYNDWRKEFCSAAPKRLLGVAILPPEDPAAACDEVSRLAKEGGYRDYPHPDSTWPNSRRAVDEQMAHLSPKTRRQLTHDNAAALYGLH